MSKALLNLNEALNRLVSNTPIRVPKDSKINNDTVALEAGLKRGAVKRSRPELAELLDNIKEAVECLLKHLENDSEIHIVVD